MQKLPEMGCVLARDGLRMKFKTVLRKITTGFVENNELVIPVIEVLKRHASRYGVKNLLIL